MKPTIPTAAAWQCQTCDRHNAPGRTKCICGHPRPEPRPPASEAPPARQAAIPRVQTRTGAERGLQRDCEALLRARGIEFLHLSPRAREKRGWPDLTFCARGAPYAVELKGAGGRLTPDQTQCLTRLAGNGWCTAVVRSVADLLVLVDGLALHADQPGAWTGVYPTTEG